MLHLFHKLPEKVYTLKMWLPKYMHTYIYTLMPHLESTRFAYFCVTVRLCTVCKANWKCCHKEYITPLHVCLTYVFQCQQKLWLFQVVCLASLYTDRNQKQKARRKRKWTAGVFLSLSWHTYRTDSLYTALQQTSVLSVKELDWRWLLLAKKIRKYQNTYLLCTCISLYAQCNSCCFFCLF